MSAMLDVSNTGLRLSKNRNKHKKFIVDRNTNSVK